MYEFACVPLSVRQGWRRRSGALMSGHHTCERLSCDVHSIDLSRPVTGHDILGKTGPWLWADMTESMRVLHIHADLSCVGVMMKYLLLVDLIGMSRSSGCACYCVVALVSGLQVPA